jgi:hypothetical protein
MEHDDLWGEFDRTSATGSFQGREEPESAESHKSSGEFGQLLPIDYELLAF